MMPRRAGPGLRAEPKREVLMRRTIAIAIAAFALLALAASPAGTTSASLTGAIVRQGTQSDSDYAASYTTAKVKNVIATTQRTSCYTPEAAFFTSDGPNDGYTGMSECTGADTLEDPGPYPTQQGSNPGYPAAKPMLDDDCVPALAHVPDLDLPGLEQRDVPVREPPKELVAAS